MLNLKSGILKLKTQDVMKKRIKMFIPGSWNLSIDKKVINITAEGESYSLTILRLTESEIVVSYMKDRK